METGNEIFGADHWSLPEGGLEGKVDVDTRYCRWFGTTKTKTGSAVATCGDSRWYWYFHTGTVSRRKPTNPPLSKPPTKFPKTQLPSPAPINSPPTFPPMKWVTLPPVEPTKFPTPLPSSKPPTSRQPTNYPVGKPTNPPTKFPTPLPSSKPPTSQPTSVGDLLVSGAVDQQQLVTPPSNNNENSNNNNINTQEEGGGATTSWEQSNDPDSLCTHNNSIKLVCKMVVVAVTEIEIVFVNLLLPYY
jgi:hypothetical protein